MLTYEKKIWNNGVNLIAGIDEVGRGCLCGDVVAACVILNVNEEIIGVNDSKKLTPKKREELFVIIQEKAIAIGIGRVDAKIVDEINIKQATRLAMKKAVECLDVRPEMLLIDAEEIESDIPQLAIIKGDQKSQSIAAASIIAKVTRDRMCIEWDSQYPCYGIKHHKGYGTKLHIEMIQENGTCQLHRKTFLGNILKQSQFNNK
ncbi:MAG: ribonuclease HII [Vulcanibacillus sp.]